MIVDAVVVDIPLYVLNFVRHAIIPLDVHVLLSIQAVNEQLEENAGGRARERETERARGRKRERAFFICQYCYEDWFGLYFLKEKEEKKREQAK